MSSLIDNAYVVPLPERLHGYSCNRNRFLFAKVKNTFDTRDFPMKNLLNQRMPLGRGFCFTLPIVELTFVKHGVTNVIKCIMLNKWSNENIGHYSAFSMIFVD